MLLFDGGWVEPAEIDRIVNEMYGLDEEEIAIIKNETGEYHSCTP